MLELNKGDYVLMFNSLFCIVDIKDGMFMTAKGIITEKMFDYIKEIWHKEDENTMVRIWCREDIECVA